MKPKVTKIKPAGKNHQVISVTGGDCLYRKEPCEECPWKKESEIGAFPSEAFRISAPTAYDMADRTFGCHMQGKEKPAICAGFILKGSTHNLNVRVAMIKGDLDLSKVS